MKRYSVYRVTLHVAYSCNMSCHGCVTLSDRPREGVADYEDLIQGMQQWSKVLDPQWVIIFGGEPLMHPRIKDILRQVRQCWPLAKISICTNALLLRKIIDSQLMRDIAPVELRVSLHKDNDEGRFFKSLIADFMALFPGWQLNNTPIGAGGNHPSKSIPYKFAYENPAGISIAVSQNEEFVIPYTWDSTGQITPYTSDPDRAFAHCVSPANIYLYKNLLYKCFPYPNLQDTQADFDRRWPSFRPYHPGDDLTEFFANLHHAHAICSMCPESGQVQHNDPKTVKILPKASWIQKQVKLNT